ncbi:MAG: S41 family peptidase [Christensenellales bacterium]|jgi:carboxyl-terminal processing protease
MIDRKRALTYAAILVITVAFITTVFTMAITGGLSGVRDGFVLNSEQYQQWTYYKEFEQLKDIIDDQYYKPVNSESLYDGALKGLVSALGDPYSSYYTADEYQAKLEELSGTYSGAGMSVTADTQQDRIVITKVFKNSPAAKSGILAGDIILQIDGKAVGGMQLEQTTDLIKGNPGTRVTLTLMRGEKVFDVELTRANIEVERVQWRMLPGKVGYIRITEFNGDCVQAFDDAVKAIRKDGGVALILDLRDNPGGYFDAAVKIADRLLPEGRIVSTRNRAGKEETWDSDAGHIGLPLALLINKYSASAAEIVAAAVKDADAGKLVGEDTYGKGIVQSLVTLKDGSGLKLTTSEYFSPRGQKINGVGVKPDIASDLPGELKKDPSRLTDENDAQLKAALELFRDLMPTPSPTATPAPAAATEAPSPAAQATATKTPSPAAQPKTAAPAD